jgi:limonene-1,2-epoxide hydrolase
MRFWTELEADGAKAAAPVTRRRALATAVTGIAAPLLLPAQASAATWSNEENDNARTVNEFCKAWASHDFDKLMSSLAANVAYRVDETHDPIKGKEAVGQAIKKGLHGVKEFKVLDTLAKGPMVFTERMDSFAEGPLKSWHGVGVFFLKKGKIVEWYDYTIAMNPE